MAAFNEKQQVPSFEGEVVVVTGGGSGIGAATCRVLLAAAAKAVYSLDIKQDEDQPYVKHINCDVSCTVALQNAVTKIVSEQGRIDHLITSAGVWSGGDIKSVSEFEFDRVVGVNIKGVFFVVQSVLPTMLKQKSGSIVIVGSDQSFIGKENQQLYGLTKAAVAQFSKSLAIQYAKAGIRVNCICPGTIDTPLVDRAVGILSLSTDVDEATMKEQLNHAQPYPRIGNPAEVAHAIAFMSKIPFIVGAQLSIDGGYVAQ